MPIAINDAINPIDSYVVAPNAFGRREPTRLVVVDTDVAMKLDDGIQMFDIALYTDWEVNADYHYAPGGELVMSLPESQYRLAGSFTDAWRRWCRRHNFAPSISTSRDISHGEAGSGRHVNITVLSGDQYDKKSPSDRLWHYLCYTFKLYYDKRYSFVSQLEAGRVEWNYPEEPPFQEIVVITTEGPRTFKLEPRYAECD